jgi:citrate lyase subunit beta/citryl-CoA lyase
MQDQIEFSLPLFVPADRPERVSKAIRSKTDSIIIDLEDAVAPSAKLSARTELERVIAAEKIGGAAVFVRINAANTPWQLMMCPRFND